MKKIVEIKAMSQDKAIERALKILDASIEQIIRVEEKVKSKSFLGFFNREGIYEVEIDTKNIKDKNDKVEENISVEIIPESIISTKKDLITEEVLIKANELLNKMNLCLKTEIVKKDSKSITINLYGEDNGIIIGKKGKTLNSFEYLLNILIKDIKIDVDVEGFKEKRNNTLKDLARKMAEKALQTDKTVRLNPMPPRERKIIHEIINRYPELDTYSEGKDPKRYIVIKRKK
jgi:spoIIIJ-associated protein